MAEFEPQIVAFCCNWCTYAAADLAGTSRVHYPANVKIVRVMCSGRVNPLFVIKRSASVLMACWFLVAIPVIAITLKGITRRCAAFRC
jgi:hypothetical protein